ncbi:MAG: GLUG motif-containing protein, partial [Cellulosilyticaceae bacterium]
KNLGVVDCMIRGRQYVGGIVGKISANSSIEKCYVIGEIVASGNYVGGIAGYSDYYNRMQKCYTRVTISGQGKNIGGIVGYSSYKSVVAHCYSTGPIKSIGDCVGGIGGYNGSSCSMMTCYTTSDVQGESYVGGIVGKSESYEELGIIENCITLSNILEGKVAGRIIGNVSEIGINNYAYKGLLMGNQQVTTGVLDNQNGEDLTRQQISHETTYLTKEFNYQNGWILRQGKLPRLVGIKDQEDQLPDHLLVPKSITVINMDVMAPRVGDVPKEFIDVNNETYHVKEISWEPRHGQFEPDTVYGLKMTLEAQKGFEFGEVVAHIPSSQSVSIETPSHQIGERVSLKVKFPKTQLPLQKGEPSFESGIPVKIGEPIRVGEGTLKITSAINYTWYRTKSKDATLQKAQLIGEMTEYMPEAEDIGYYLMVVARTPEAVGEASVMTQQITKYSYEGEVLRPLLEKVSQDSITLKDQEGYEYALVKGGEEVPKKFTTNNRFLYLVPDTEYDLYQRIAATKTHEASEPRQLSVTTAKIFIHTITTPVILSETAVTVGDVIRKPQEMRLRTNVEGLELVPEWMVFDENNNPIPLDGTVIGESNELYIFKAMIKLPSSKYCFNPQLEKMSGVKVSVGGETLTYTFIFSTTPHRKSETPVTRPEISEPSTEQLPAGKPQKDWKKDISDKDIMRPTSNLGPNHMGVWNLHVRS